MGPKLRLKDKERKLRLMEQKTIPYKKHQHTSKSNRDIPNSEKVTDDLMKIDGTCIKTDEDTAVKYCDKNVQSVSSHAISSSIKKAENDDSNTRSESKQALQDLDNESHKKIVFVKKLKIEAVKDDENYKHDLESIQTEGNNPSIIEPVKNIATTSFDVEKISDYILKNKRNMMLQMTKHFEQTQFHCHICTSFRTNTKAALIQHELAHMQKTKQCFQCPYKANARQSLEYHFYRHMNDEAPFKCRDCSYATTTKRFLKKHEMLHKPFKCNVCPFRTKTKDDLDQHQKMQSHRDEVNETNIVLCKQCRQQNGSCKIMQNGNVGEVDELLSRTDRTDMGKNSGASSESGEKKEKNNDTIEPLLECSKCGSKNNSTLTGEDHKLHQLKHHSEVEDVMRPFKCDKCPFQAKTEIGLKRHRANKIAAGHKERTQQPLTRRQFQCEECPFKSPSKPSLKHHIMMHKTPAPFPCTSCSFKTKSLICLRIHQKVHGTASSCTDEEPLILKTHCDSKLETRVDSDSCDVDNESSDITMEEEFSINEHHQIFIKCEETKVACSDEIDEKELLLSHKINNSSMSETENNINYIKKENESLISSSDCKFDLEIETKTEECCSADSVKANCLDHSRSISGHEEESINCKFEIKSETTDYDEFSNADD